MNSLYAFPRLGDMRYLFLWMFPVFFFGHRILGQTKKVTGYAGDPYDLITKFKDDYFTVQRNDGYAIINLEGKTIFSSIFGGIPATGAIARTATNVKNGGHTPVAGIVHAITLLLIMLFIGQWAALIPMAMLAGILVVVAYNMSDWESFVAVFKGPRCDVAVLLTTFLLTVLVDLTVAIEIGMVLAIFLFMRKMIQFSDVSILTKDIDDNGNKKDENTISNFTIPENVEVFEITGPLFFGAAYKFKDAMKLIEKTPEILIIRMRRVSIIDATGIRVLEEVYKETKRRGTKLILSEVHSEQVMKELRDARLLFAVGKANITKSFKEALVRCSAIV